MLQWDFYKTITNATGVGGTIHYYNEKAQSFYLDNGVLCGLVTDVNLGHWNGAVEGDYDIFDSDFSSIALDHPTNGTIYGLATDGTNLWYLRYTYSMDISDMYDSGQWREQVDNQVKSLSLSVKNTSAETFVADYTLFNPGAKISLYFTAGDSEPYNIGVAYIDDIDYDAYASTIPMSARNSVGFFLSEQSFDDHNIYSGGRSTVFTSILTDTGLTKYHIQQDDTTLNVEFNPDTMILEGLNTTLKTLGWRMVELPDGYIVIGDETFISGYNSNGRYTFNGGKEVFTRQTSKNADVAYTRVCVRNQEGLMVYRPVPCWSYWNIGARKTKYYDAPEGYTVADMEILADIMVSELQYVGMGEEFSSPIRPQLQVGDVADIFYDGDVQSTTLGIITQVTHSFGKDGFRTDFSLDSGGTTTDANDYTITKTAILNGYNRKQRVSDFIGIVAEKKVTSVYSGGGQVIVQGSVPEAASITPASILRIL